MTATFGLCFVKRGHIEKGIFSAAMPAGSSENLPCARVYISGYKVIVEVTKTNGRSDRCRIAEHHRLKHASRELERTTIEDNAAQALQ